MTFDLENIILFCTSVGAISTVITLVYKVVRPLTGWKKEVEHKLDRDYKIMRHFATQQQAITRAMIAVLKHLECGNNTGQMAAARDALTECLIFREDERDEQNE